MLVFFVIFAFFFLFDNIQIILMYLYKFVVFPYGAATIAVKYTGMVY